MKINCEETTRDWAQEVEDLLAALDAAEDEHRPAIGRAVQRATASLIGAVCGDLYYGGFTETHVTRVILRGLGLEKILSEGDHKDLIADAEREMQRYVRREARNKGYILRIVRREDGALIIGINRPDHLAGWLPDWS